MNKDGLFQELDSLIEDGKKELSKYSYIDDPYEFQYVDKFFFEPWYYKVLTILVLLPELANNPFSNSISHLNDAFYSDVEMIIKDLEAIKELVKFQEEIIAEVGVEKMEYEVLDITAELRKEGYNNPEDLLLVICDNKEKLTIYTKNEKINCKVLE